MLSLAMVALSQSNVSAKECNRPWARLIKASLEETIKFTQREASGTLLLLLVSALANGLLVMTAPTRTWVSPRHSMLAACTRSLMTRWRRRTQTFDRCDKPLNVTSDCYLKCYSEATHRASVEELTAPWEYAFNGGCPLFPVDALNEMNEKLFAAPDYNFNNVETIIKRTVSEMSSAI